VLSTGDPAGFRNAGPDTDAATTHPRSCPGLGLDVFNIWTDVAFYTMIGGIVGAFLAAIPGLVDLISLSGRPKTLGIWHMAINLVAVAVFVVNALLRTTSPRGDIVPFVLSIIVRPADLYHRMAGRRDGARSWSKCRAGQQGAAG
jgi:hypothetical protein